MAEDISDRIPTEIENTLDPEFVRWLETNFSKLKSAASGSFLSQDGKTITVLNGIITEIV